jgi:hypothetical protein
VLAELPFSVYLTTNPDDTMAAALRAAGKKPASENCPWFQSGSESPSVAAATGMAAPIARLNKPDEKNPLVYHLFGRFSCRESLVLTEDDYLDCMLGLVLNKSLIEPSGLRAMKNRLLFLGFPIDHWTFRALWRTFSRVAIGGRSAGYNDIAVQVNPEEGRFRDPSAAEDYLGTSFEINKSRVQVYWGRVQDFILELGERWKARPRAGEGIR